jgi:hypothetical protein
MLGQQPKLQELASREKQQSVSPMPADLLALPIAAPGNLTERVQASRARKTRDSLTLYD